MKQKLPGYNNVIPHGRPIYDTPLAAWLEATNTAAFTLAKQIGCDPKTVYLAAKGQSIPTLIMAFKLEQATKGGVPVASWLGTELCKLAWDNGGVNWHVFEQQRAAERKRRARRDA